MPDAYQAIRDADANLAIADPQQAVDALNGLTTTKTNQKFVWRDAKRRARESATGDWARIVVRSGKPANLPPTSLEDAAILTAINAVQSADDDVIDPNDPASWQTWQQGLTTLHAVGDLSDDTLAALQSIQNVTAPTWRAEWGFNLPLTVDDLLSIRAGS